MHWSKWSYSASACVALCLGSSATYGQTANEAKAEELFNKAVELSEARNFNDACPLLAESQKLDPRPGTLYALADCEREAKKPASAVGHFKAYLQEYAAMKPDVRRRHDQRANTAQAFVKATEPQLPMLKLTFRDGIPSEFVLTRNGEPVERISLDKDLAVDPGEQVIVLKMAGREDAEQRITIQSKEQKTIELVPGATAQQNPDDGLQDKPKKNLRRTAGFVLLGTGAAGVVFGGVMGGLAVGQKGVVADHCKGLDCDAQGLDAADHGRTYGNASTIGLVAGGVIAVTGLVLVLTTPKAKPQTGLITGIGGTANSQGAFLSVEGQF